MALINTLKPQRLKSERDKNFLRELNQLCIGTKDIRRYLWHNAANLHSIGEKKCHNLKRWPGKLPGNTGDQGQNFAVA